MAILNADQSTEWRRAVSQELVPMRLNKAQANAVLQAIEDVWESAAVKNAFSNAIDAASTPVALTNADKKLLVKFWLRQRFDRGN